MAIDLASNTEVVRDEIAWLGRRLSELEDWRALGQLEAREARGEGLNAVDGQRLKALLLQSLSDNPLFERYNFLLAQTALAPNVALAKPLTAHKPVAAPAALADDLVRIRGISKILARRLAGLGVASFAQIANWTSADVHHVANTLGIGRQISSENWIEQAALLARGAGRPQPHPEIAIDAIVPIPVAVGPRARAMTIAPAPPATVESAADEQAPVADQRVEFATASADVVSTDSPIPPAPLAARSYASAGRMTATDALAILGLLPLARVNAILPGFAEPEIPFAAEPVVVPSAVPELVSPEPTVPEQPGFEAAALELDPVVLGPPPMPLLAPAFAVKLEEQTANMVEVLALPPCPLPASPFYIAREMLPVDDPPVSVSPSNEPETAEEPASIVSPLAADVADVIVDAPDEPSPVAVQDAGVLAAVPSEPLPAPPLPLSAAHYTTGFAAKRRVEREHWMVDTASELRAIERLLAQPMPGQFKAQRSAPEAQVTIKRGLEAQPQAARQPVPVEVPLKRPPPQPQPDAFDGSNYAAYRDHIEEASVEIIKHREGADTAQPPPSVPEQRIRSSAALEFVAKSTLDWLVRAMRRA